MTLDPQAKAILDAIAQLPPVDYANADAAALRAPPDAPSPFAAGDSVAREVDHSIAGPGGPLRLRLYYGADDAGPLPMVLCFHGGGFVVGSIEANAGISRCLARRAGALLLSVDYRLAPEAPFPAAVDDACAALDWAWRNAEAIGGDAGRIAVAGDSAGGNLAAAAAQYWRGRTPALRHQLLIYPVMDCRTDTASYRDFAEGYGLTRDNMRWYFRQYLRSAAEADDPRASPLRAASLSGLAPATVITAEYDVLRDEGEAYAAALRAAGVPVQMQRWPGQIHGFAGMFGAVDAADQLMTLGGQALRRAFATEPAPR